MMKQLQQLLLITAFLLSVNLASAQLGLGFGISYGTDVKELGLFGRLSYQFADQWRGATTLNYYLDGVENTSIWNADFDAHYLFWRGSGLSAYALAGLALATFSYNEDVVGVDASSTDVGLNLGAGLQYQVGDAVAPFVELKYDIGGFEQLALLLGLQYRFVK